jgi:hypothetical protein
MATFRSILPATASREDPTRGFLIHLFPPDNSFSLRVQLRQFRRRKGQCIEDQKIFHLLGANLDEQTFFSLSFSLVTVVLLGKQEQQPQREKIVSRRKQERES